MFRLVKVLALLVLAYFVVTSAVVIDWMGRDDRARTDAIVVLGAAQYDGRPSPILRARLDHALDLYRSGVAPLMVFTGGNEPGDRFTEGGTGQRYAVAQGVPATATLVEQSSRTTYGNLQGAERLLAARHLRRVVLVSDPFHMLRAVREADDLGLRAAPSPTRTSPISHRPVELAASILREDVAIGAYLAAGLGG